MRSKAYQKGFTEGQEAVRRKPMYAPDNPYDWGRATAVEQDRLGDTERDLYEGWEDGAFSAGICDIYYNGVLMKEYR